jgi:hypothetical protein
MKETITAEKIAELRKDFETLCAAYWYAISTRECHRFPGEQEKDELFAKELMEKWSIK